MKFLIALLLLLTAVPAGCLPIVVAGSVAEEVAARNGKRPGRAPAASREGTSFIAIFAALAVTANVVLFFLFRSVRKLGDDGATLGLGRGAWRVLLWMAFVCGAGCGAAMFLT